jgi:hypothetical protein
MTDKIVHTTLDVERRSFERRFQQRYEPNADNTLVSMMFEGEMLRDGKWKYKMTHVQYAWSGWQMCLSAHDTVMA